jgi:hypothetical protein
MPETEKLLRCYQRISSQKRFHFFREGCFLVRFLLTLLKKSIVSTRKQVMILCRLNGSFVTHYSMGDIDETKHKQACLSSPMSPHTIAKLRVPVIAETVSVDDIAEEEEENYAQTDNIDVALVNPFICSAVNVNELNPDDYNLLIPQLDLFQFIKDNINCKKCNSTILQRNLVTARIECVCNIFWSCSNCSSL